MMYFVVCDEKTYDKYFYDDLYAVKLEDVSQLIGQRNPIVKFFNSDFKTDEWDIALETLAVVGYIHLIYVELFQGEMEEDKYYPTSGRLQ
jgi:hypothetical protein